MKSVIGRRPKRVSALLSTVLGLPQTRVVGVEFTEYGVVVDVKPATRVPRCSGCFYTAPKVYDRRVRLWRHRDLAGMYMQLRYSLRRVRCPHCGIKVELVPWAEPRSWFTREFEDVVGYMAQRQDKTSITESMRISWRIVGDIVTRVVARELRGDPLDGLKIIGIDELSFRRHHAYVTVVVDHERRAVVWAKEGKNAETLNAFFDDLGAERAAKLEAVTIDMSGAYIKAVTTASPNARLVFDRFHVQRLAHDALDEVRRDEVRKVHGTPEASTLKHTRWALQKSPWTLTPGQQDTLSDVQRNNARIFRAYMLKESLCELLDHADQHDAPRRLDQWIRWARRSRLAPFKRIAATLRTHRAGVLAYVDTRLSNGRTEGLNGKARTITRRSYGFHSAAPLIAMLFLCCSGIMMLPMHVYPA
jgi:transposase